MENKTLKELNIENLPYPLCVRTRPGMYIGTVANPSKLISEIIDNSCDEVYEGGNDVIWVNHINDYYIIADRGRGIPVKTAIISEIDEKTGELVSHKGNITQAEFSMNSLHAGSKFNKTGMQAGLNGVGSSVTNALSDNYILLVTLGNKNERVKDMPPQLIEEYNQNKNVTHHYIWYSKGIYKSRGFCNISDIKELFGIDLKIDFNPSTLVMFRPDKEIFDEIKGYYPTNLKFVKKIAEYNKKKLDIIIEGKVNEDELKSFGYDFNVTIESEYLGRIEESKIRNPRLELIASIGVNPTWGNRDCIGSVNGLHTPAGTHCKMLEKAFRNAWTRYYGDAFGTELSSLNYYILAICNNPVFDSQTKVRLDQVPDINIRNLDSLEAQIIKAFKKNSEVWDLYAEKVRTQIKDVKNLSKINLIKTKIVIAADNPKAEMFMPKKLIDCSTKNRSEAELYVCFTGDTEILDCNNNRIAFKDLKPRIESGEEIYTYSFDKNGSVYPSKIIKCGIVNKAQDLIKVTLDNGELFKCTPDHKILMRNGEYKQAKDLAVDDSCMPLYIREVESEDYGGCKRRVIKCPKSNKYNFRHCYNSKNNETEEFYCYRIMGMHPDVVNKSSGNDVVNLHHIDHNSLNDSPSNLIRVDAKWHHSHHGGMKLLDNYKNGEFNEFYGSTETKRIHISESNKKYWENASNDIRNSWSEIGKQSREYQNIEYCKKLIDYMKSNNYELKYSNFDSLGKKLYPNKHFNSIVMNNKYPDLFKELTNDYFENKRDVIQSILNKLISMKLSVTHNNFKNVGKTLGYFLGKGFGLRPNQYARIRKYFINEFSEAEAVCNVNHKVADIEHIHYDEPVDVYCLTVDNELHNFPLAAGIAVANCEGDSAAGGFIKARDSYKHAILPLRGRPLNTVYMDITEVLKNQEMCDFITCTGVGVNDYHSLSKIRYGKIIIATDMDPDGAAIASSILCTIIDHQRFLIDAGYVYICLSPFFIQGNNYYYFAEDFDKLDKNKPFSRIKGLGELNPIEIKDSILNPQKRVLIRVTSDHVNNALDLLTRTGARRQLLMDEGIISDAYLDRDLMAEIDKNK